MKPILANSPLIVIGYGGNDESVMKFLSTSGRENVYWCVRDTKNISNTITQVLGEEDRIVHIEGFDQLMVALNAKVYKFESINTLKAEKAGDSVIVQKAIEKFENYKKQLENLEKQALSDGSEEFKENLTSILPDWWAYQLKADKASSGDEKEEVYLEGMEAYPLSSELVGNYAYFLTYSKKDYDKAEKYFVKAIELDSDNVNSQANYALFLTNKRIDYNKAEKHYLITIEIDSNSVEAQIIYAQFLSDNKNDYDKAEKYFRKAINQDPSNAPAQGYYANFLTHIKGDHDKAEILYLNALKTDPSNILIKGNYANFLTKNKQEHDRAEVYYLEYLELEPDNQTLHSTYASFLSTVRKDYDNAEKYFLKALELDSDDAIAHHNYASFLTTIQKDNAKAGKHFKKALELDSRIANIQGNYASYLFCIGKTAKAKEHYNNAMSLLTKEKDLLLELWFYKYAHFEEKYHEEAKLNLSKILEQGLASHGWDFTNNIEKAIKDNHHEVDTLKEYAKKISGIDYSNLGR